MSGSDGAGGPLPGQVEAPGPEAVRLPAPGTGLYTDMNAIRRDEEVDNLHSVYVDQWDWEKVITRQDRNVDYLKAHGHATSWAPSARPARTLRMAFPSLHR